MQFLFPYLSSTLIENLGFFYLRSFWENAPNCLQCFNPDRVIEINNTDNNIELGSLPRKRYSKKRHVRGRPSKKRSRF